MLFIFDLYLEEFWLDIIEVFLGFFWDKVYGVYQFYIFGDFFEVWIGDDECILLQEQVVVVLCEVKVSGIDIFFMYGNWDFLIGQDYCECVGVILLDDFIVVDLYGIFILLMYGDSLCMVDVEYQKFCVNMCSFQW